MLQITIPGVSGTGGANRVAFWSSVTALSSDPLFTYTSGLLAAPSILISGAAAFGSAALTPGSQFNVGIPTNAGPGTITVTATLGTVTGVGTTFLETFYIGQTITANLETHTITAIASDTAMTTDVWTGSAIAVPYTIAGNANAFVIDQAGRIGIGQAPVTSQLIAFAPTLTNPGPNVAISITFASSQTAASFAGNSVLANFVARVGAANTQNWTGGVASSLICIQGSSGVLAGATGTIGNITSVLAAGTISAAGVTVTNFWAFFMKAISNSGTITNVIGYNTPAITQGGTANIHILLGTQTVPAGNWGIYDASTYNWYMTGKFGIGVKPILSPLAIAGLPTAAAGLNAGDVWCDTTGGLNILKIV